MGVAYEITLASSTLFVFNSLRPHTAHWAAWECQSHAVLISLVMLSPGGTTLATNATFAHSYYHQTFSISHRIGYQAIGNFEPCFSLVRFCGIHWRAISQPVLKLRLFIMSLQILLLNIAIISQGPMIKGLIMVRRELQQQHPSVLSSGAGTSQEMSPSDNTSRGCCCHTSLSTMINSDYNMTKQVVSNVYTTKKREREEPHQARKILWVVNARRLIFRYQNHVYGLFNHHKHIDMRLFFVAQSQWIISTLVRRWQLACALHCDIRDCLTPGVVALHILPSGATTTVSCQKSTRSYYNWKTISLYFLSLCQVDDVHVEIAHRLRRQPTDLKLQIQKYAPHLWDTSKLCY